MASEAGAYDDARLRMEAYVERIRRGKSLEGELVALIDARTNVVTRYI